MRSFSPRPESWRLAAFRKAIAENLRQAQMLAQLIEAEPSLERLAPVELSAVCFRWTGGEAQTPLAGAAKPRRCLSML